LTRAAALMRLQRADEQIAELRSEVASLEAALRGDPELDRRRKLAAASTSVQEESSAELTDAEKDLTALELRVRTLDRRLYDGSVKNPHELLEMQRELEALRGQVGVLEDRLLTLIEGSEAAAQDAQAATLAVAELEQQRDADTEPRQRRLAALQGQLGEAIEQREALAAEATASDRALYARVAALHHPAVVSIAGDACGGCHLPLSNEERRAVRAGVDVVQCSNCDRVLVP